MLRKKNGIHAFNFFPDADSGTANVTLGIRCADKVTQTETHFCHPKCIYRYMMTVVMILTYSIQRGSHVRWEEGAHMGGRKRGLTQEVGRGGSHVRWEEGAHIWEVGRRGSHGRREEGEG